MKFFPPPRVVNTLYRSDPCSQILILEIELVRQLEEMFSLPWSFVIRASPFVCIKMPIYNASRANRTQAKMVPYLRNNFMFLCTTVLEDHLTPTRYYFFCLSRFSVK